MIALLRQIPATVLLVIALAAAVVYQYAQTERYQAERDTAQARVTRAEERAEALGEVMDWQRDQMRSLARALDTRQAQITADAQAMTAKRDALTALERDDAPTRDWSAEPVPSAVADWLRDLPPPGDPDA